MSILQNLVKTTSRSKKRLGRGYGSGKGGHTSSRGQKGQGSRVGSKVPLWFEGGQLPLVKRMPMLKGKGKFKVVRPTAEVTLSNLNQLAEGKVTLDTLKVNKIIGPRFKKAKVIHTGKLEKKFELEGILATKSAKAEIEKLGGSVN